ncbi:MAG: protein-export chaperone SecB [Xanthomonadales bacterium]|nr:protein-export chaperone SecB [Xanthomonadales bacterium]
MSNQNPVGNGQAAGTPAQPSAAQLTIHKIYLKDASFEVPGGAQVFQEQGQPQFKLELNQRVERISDDTFEVVLGVTLTCELAEKVVFLAEIKQAGIFGLAGFDERGLQSVLGTYCPQTLFPYARSIISELVMNGGFPPFVLQPINFDQLFAEQMRRRSEEQAAGSPAQAPADSSN